MSDHKPYRDSHEPDEPLREHVFDGIREFDKKLPNWWLLTLYGSIVFSIAYWAWFHIYEIARTPEEKLALAQERAVARAAAGDDRGFDDDRLLKLALEDSAVNNGRSAYMASCAACHGMELEGGIGPGLVDAEWVHGGRPTEILKIVLDGVAAKGMPAWRSMLGERRSAEVTAYIISMNPDILSAAPAPDEKEEDESPPAERS